MGKLKVYILEDDPMVLSINKQFTERLPGFAVVGAGMNGAGAVEQIRRAAPDLVLVDIYLPEQDGLEVIRQVRGLGLDLDVIFVTAARDSGTITEALRCGAIDYLIKPFDFERFREALEGYARLRAKLRPAEDLAQAQVDRLRGVNGGNAGAAGGAGAGLPPKGIDVNTLQLIAGYLMQAQRALSAEEVAAGLGISRITARRYLEHLAGLGKVMVEQVYGSVGRPLKRYIMDQAG